MPAASPSLLPSDLVQVHPGLAPMDHRWDSSCRGFWEMLLRASQLQSRGLRLKGWGDVECQSCTFSVAAVGSHGEPGEAQMCVHSTPHRPAPRGCGTRPNRRGCLRFLGSFTNVIKSLKHKGEGRRGHQHSCPFAILEVSIWFVRYCWLAGIKERWCVKVSVRHKH